MTRSRLLFVSANTSWGGSEESWFRLAQRAAAYGLDAWVAARAYPESERRLRALTASGIGVIELSTGEAFGECLDRVRPAVVHASLGQPLALLSECEAVVARDIPLVIVEHLASDDYTLSPDDADHCRKIALYRRAAKIVYVAERNRRTLGRWVDDAARATVITHGVELSRFQPAPFRERMPLRAVCVARLALRHKGLDTLVATSARAAEEVAIDLIGTGPAGGDVRTLAANCGATLRLRGSVDDINTALLDYDAFVLLSRYEGKPTAIAEAMAAGLPCVVTDVGGQAELVRDGVTGFVVPAEDHETAATRLVTLAREPELRRRMREAALAAARRELDWRDTEESLYAVYRNALKEAS